MRSTPNCPSKKESGDRPTVPFPEGTLTFPPNHDVPGRDAGGTLLHYNGESEACTSSDVNNLVHPAFNFKDQLPQTESDNGDILENDITDLHAVEGKSTKNRNTCFSSSIDFAPTQSSKACMSLQNTNNSRSLTLSIDRVPCSQEISTNLKVNRPHTYRISSACKPSSVQPTTVQHCWPDWGSGFSFNELRPQRDDLSYERTPSWTYLEMQSHDSQDVGFSRESNGKNESCLYKSTHSTVGENNPTALGRRERFSSDHHVVYRRVCPKLSCVDAESLDDASIIVQSDTMHDGQRVKQQYHKFGAEDNTRNIELSPSSQCTPPHPLPNRADAGEQMETHTITQEAIPLQQPNNKRRKFPRSKTNSLMYLKMKRELLEMKLSFHYTGKTAATKYNAFGKRNNRRSLLPGYEPDTETEPEQGCSHWQPPINFIKDSETVDQKAQRASYRERDSMEVCYGNTPGKKPKLTTPEISFGRNAQPRGLQRFRTMYNTNNGEGQGPDKRSRTSLEDLHLWFDRQQKFQKAKICMFSAKKRRGKLRKFGSLRISFLKYRAVHDSFVQKLTCCDRRCFRQWARSLSSFAEMFKNY